MFLRFVYNLKSHINSSKIKWLVLGNESSDLDSVVSSLAYAYFKQDMVGDDIAVIPVCCISRDNLKLKKDVTRWLNLFDINPDTDLIFLDDVKHLIYKDGNDNPIKMTLLDHHKPMLPFISTAVKEVIDHRQISYDYPLGQLELFNIKLVGSCCTLISKYIMEKLSLDSRSTLLEMLRGVILLDTDCLKINNGKTTEEDISMVTEIESTLNMSSSTRQDIYNCLAHAKTDISDLSISMMIKRDLKILNFTWNSSILKMALPTLISVDVEDLLSIEDLEIQLTEILTDLKVDIIMGLTCGSLEHDRIGLLIFSDNIDLNNKILEYLSLPENCLDLHSLLLQNNTKGLFFGIRITRKTFIPIIEQFFKNEIEESLGEQINNCNADTNHGIHFFIKTVDSDVALDTENEGAPYTLNTPLRSYSASPDNRNSENTLPSLNNRYTRQLVDHKRRRHRASMHDESILDDDIKDIEIPNNDDFSPRTFTPENTDDESISDYESDSKKHKDDSLPLVKDCFIGEKKKSRQEKSQEEMIASISTTEISKTNEINGQRSDIYKSKLNDKLNFAKDDIDETDFISLADKVDQKRQKLYSTNLISVANSLVTDVLNESKDIVSAEVNIESMLDDWSECYVGDEKHEIIESFKINDLSKVAELLTTSLMRECLKNHETKAKENEVNNNAKEDDLNVSKIQNDQCIEIVDTDSDSCLEADEPTIEITVNDCHLGNMINERNELIGPSCVNYSSADIVENSSFNLYRRISNNQMDFSVDEKELLTTAGDWLPNDETIYSDTEKDDYNENHHSCPETGINNVVSKKIIFPDKDMYIDTSNFEINTSTEISLNDLNNMPTPDLATMEELDVIEIVKDISQASSPNETSVQATGDIVDEKGNCSIIVNEQEISKFESYNVAMNDSGYYFDETNNNERTKLITLSSSDFPEKSDHNYQEIMQSIFDYTTKYLESIDSEFYTIVYFHCFGTKQKGPSLVWLHQSYQTISYRLKKNLKHLYIVHPTIWVRAALFLSRFFINTKFYSKIQYVSELEDLRYFIPTDRIRFPDEVLKES